MLEYRAENHEYRWEGKIVPSVNNVLKTEGIMPDFYSFKNVEYKRNLGKYVHTALKWYFAGTLDESSLKDEIKSYFEGAKKFIHDFSINPFEVEKPLYSKKYGFAGTPDFWTNTNYDWKVSLIKYPHYKLTMGAYDILIEEEVGQRPKEHLLIELQPNDYKIETIIPDRNSFLAFLMTYKWRLKNKKEVSSG